MTLFEFLGLLLILLLGLGGARLGYRFGVAGYIAGFIAGALLLPISIGVVLKIQGRRRRMK